MGVIEARRRILLSAPHVEATTPAGVANFQTDLISPLISLKAGFLPVQSGSGDPSPSNVRPISGWNGLTVTKCGKNLLDTGKKYADGSIVYLGSSDGEYATPLTAGTYTLSVVYAEGKSSSAYIKRDGGSAERIWTPGTDVATITLTRNGNYLFYLYSSGFSSADVVGFMLIRGSTPTPYSPYTGTTIPVTFPAAGKNLFDGQYPDMPSASSMTLKYRSIYVGDGNVTGSTNAPLAGSNSNLFLLAGKVSTGAATGGNDINENRTRTVTPIDGYITIAYRQYNGVDPREYNVQIERGSTATSYEPYRNAFYGGYVDLVRGVLVATMAIDTSLNTKNWLYSANAGKFIVPLSRAYNSGSYSTSVVANIVCSHYKPISNVNAYNGAIDKGIGLPYYNGGPMLTIVDKDYTDASVFAATLSGVQLAYQLATPIHYPLTPQIIKSLRGVNNIWSDANGDVRVEYWKH